MEKFRLLSIACFTVALLGLIPGGTATAFDGDDGGFDGGSDDGGDDGGDDDGEEDNDGEQDNHQGEDRDKDGHPDGHGHHHGHARHGRGHRPVIYGWPPFGYGPAFGFGAFGYAPPPYYAYPPAGFRQVPPGVVYIEKNGASQQTPEPQTNLWHYCQDPPGYYPEVKECASGWEQVAPQAEQDDQE